MCGLVGTLTSNTFGFNINDQKIFKQMLYADALRGEDSTGVFGVNNFGTVSVLKEASHSVDFISSPAFKSFEAEMYKGGKFMVGHNRSATKGLVNDNNAHPFTEGDITLVHNGTLTNHTSFSKKEVDSHAICELISSVGYKEAIKTIEGAFALIWFDQRSHKLYISRNSKRPLGMAKSKDGKSIYFASELALIPWIASRNSVVLENNFLIFDSEDKEEKGWVYSFDLENLKMEKEQVQFYKPKVYVHGTNYKYKNSHFYQDLWEEAEGSEVTSCVLIEDKREKKEAVPKKEKEGGVILPFGGRGSSLFEEEPPITEAELRTNLESNDFWSKTTREIVFKFEDFELTENMVTWPKILGSFLGYGIWGRVKEADLDECEKYGHLIGRVTRVHFANDKLSSIFVTNIRPYLKTYSKNGELITPETWKKYKEQLFCSDCGSEIMMREIPETIIRFNKDGTVRRVVCEHCIKQLSSTGKTNNKVKQKHLQANGYCH